MEWTVDQLMSIIGSKEVELIGMRMRLGPLEQAWNSKEALETRLKELANPPKLEVVGKET